MLEGWYLVVLRGLRVFIVAPYQKWNGHQVVIQNDCDMKSGKNRWILIVIHSCFYNDYLHCFIFHFDVACYVIGSFEGCINPLFFWSFPVNKFKLTVWLWWGFVPYNGYNLSSSLGHCYKRELNVTGPTWRLRLVSGHNGITLHKNSSNCASTAKLILYDTNCIVSVGYVHIGQ